MGVARWGVCPQGLKRRLIFGGFSRHGQGRALTKVTPNLLPYSANLIRFGVHALEAAYRRAARDAGKGSVHLCCPSVAKRSGKQKTADHSNKM